MTYDDDRVLDSDLESDGYSDVFEDEPEPLFNFSLFKRKPREPREDSYEEPRRSRYEEPRRERYEEPRRERYEEPRRERYEEPRRERYEESRSVNYDSRRGYTAPIKAAPSVKADVSIHTPETFDEVKKIAGNLLNRCTVILNLERASTDVQIRILDFMSGVLLATDGKVYRTSSTSYVFAPDGVHIEGISVDSAASAEEATGVYI